MMDSGPPSVSPYSLNSLPLTPYGSSSTAVAASAVAAAVQRASMRADDGGAAAAEAAGQLVPAAKPMRREAAAEKLDDKAYWCLSGCLLLEAQPLPPEPDPDAATTTSLTAASSAVAAPERRHPAASPAPAPPKDPEPSGSAARSAQADAAGHPPHSPHSPGPLQLQVANPGEAFSGGALAEAAIAAFASRTHSHLGGPGTPPHTPPGQQPQAEPEASQQQQLQQQQQQQLVQALPLGASVLRARVAEGGGGAGGGGGGGGGGAGGGGGGAEVLCMSRTMFELLSNGIGRSVPPAVLPVLARHVDWLAGLDLQALATDLSGHYRLEEHKQGTELLRAGEAAPVVFLVAAGECLMRGPVVGLREPGSVADQLDLATLREGATCGELSLLAARPLWYTLVVSSLSAKVVSLDMPALRAWLLTSPMGRAAAADVVATVAEVDIALYGKAVKQIAAQVMSEKLEMSLFNLPMKKILRRVIEDNGPELTATMERQRERDQEREAQQQQEAKAKGQGKAGHEGSLGGPAASGPTGPGGGAASSTSKRPRDIVLEGWNQVEAIAASLARPYDPQAQSWELIAQARYNAARRHHNRYLDSLLAASQLSTREDAGGHPAGDQHIAMPAHGLLAEALAEPGPVRSAKQFDIRTVPKDLRGCEVESSRLSWDCAYVPLHELVTMMGAQLHIKQAAALQLLQQQQQQQRQQQSLPQTQVQRESGKHQHQHQRQQPEGQQAPPGCSAAVGASNYLIAHKAGGGSGSGGSLGAAAVTVRLPSGCLQSPRGAPAAPAAAAATPSTEASSSPAHSPRRTVFRLVPTAPWDAKGRLPGAGAASGGPGDGGGGDGASSADPLPSPGRVYRDSTFSVSGWSTAPLEALGGRSTGYLSHAASTSSLALVDPELRAQLEMYPSLTLESVSMDAVARGLAVPQDTPLNRGPLGSIPEEPSIASSLALSRSLDLAPGSPAKAPPGKALPPLPPPHGPAATDGGGGAVGAGGAKRSRIAGRAASPTQSDAADDPTRSFWVRDKLHDPQGLAESVMADAAAKVVGQTLAARGLLAPRSDDGAALVGRASSPGSGSGPSANVLLAAGGRSALPASGRSTRLQPLRRNGSSSARSAGTWGGAAAAAVAPTAAATAAAGAAGGTAAAAGSGAPTPALAAQPPPDSEMLYVTLQLPEAPKILPEFPSPAALREAAEAAAAAERAAREARLAAAISHHSTRPLQIRPDMKYVPQYLRQRQRPPVIPPPVRPLPEGPSESWVVPSYSSEVGFQDGFYDENSQVIYFD